VLFRSVVSESAFTSLVATLPDHRGLLVTDAQVAQGRDFYWAKEQKVALVYHRRFTVESARVVVTDASASFGGRPPLEVKLRFDENGRPRTLVVLVVHFKAMANLDGYTRRAEATVALKRYLDAEYPARWVLVMGDFNDDLDASTYRHSPSPLAPFVNDPQWRFTTDSLTQRDVSTTLTFRSTIDHHLVTQPLAARFLEGSAKTVPVTDLIADAKTTTSDHLPVLTRYDLR
jgi:endonuclease/exonuclease/phosphatase family metal-dependent hydrolase